MDKLTIEAIRVNAGLTRQEAAEALGIPLDRYNRIANGDSKLLATEFVGIHQTFGIPYEKIMIPSK
jgi:transcriptional regulator with XRE-family HTH domain